MSGPVLVSPLGDWGWLEAGILSGDVLVRDSDVRSHISYWVRADRDGPLTRRLLTFTTDRRVSARRTVFELLDQLSDQLPGHPPGWPLMADAAEPALSDVDAQVRRIAATVLVNTAEPDRAVAALDASADPGVRINLVDGIPWYKVAGHQAILERLRSDSVPAIRLLATCATFGWDSAAWPVLDAAIRAEIDACVGVLGAPGSRLGWTAGQYWARAMTRFDREEDCCAWAERLANEAESLDVRLEGARMAVGAMRQWRAAPGRLTPVLTGLLREEPSEVRSAAVRALAASLTATRLAAADLAAVMDDPDLGAVATTALGCVGDHRAVPYLVRLMLAGSDEPRLVEAFNAVAAAGADPQAPVAAARQMLAAHADSSEPELPMRVLAAFGPAAAAAVPELHARFGKVENDTPDLTFHVLGRIGPAAVAAAPSLREFSTQAALSALVKVTSDRDLAELPPELRQSRFGSKLLAWLAEHAVLTARQRQQVRSFFQEQGNGVVEAARALWLQEGPAVALELLEVLPKFLFDDILGPKVLRLFATMGPHARPVLDRVDGLITPRRRVEIYLGDSDAEMRWDEVLLAGAIAARERIVG
ncbi:hypothetical protein HH310_04445 [Actinoplanes sp. TBRC 11911]|uniref:hypothetical protein n=1 Tax=Actinoplanes sp. TBRC 11911 TaxID=2729386 RepID=UPI00145E72B2|nr:hypothetical protein [Actinoplanes sp. TBRC 11911]NMO50441.1 hypothetical protein [Actinoplanes sp. TBRC 11911]